MTIDKGTSDMEQRAVNMLHQLDGLSPSEARSCFVYALTLLVQLGATKDKKPREFVRTFRNFITKVLKTMEERI